MHTVDYIPILFVGVAFFSLAFKMMSRYLQARAL